MDYKISDVTKALKQAGFVKLDENTMFGPRVANSYYKYNGSLYIEAGQNIGFTISSAKEARVFGKYQTSATDETNASYQVDTDIPEFFFPRLLGYLAGIVSEEQIIKEICK